jgi:hypothetical protein
MVATERAVDRGAALRVLAMAAAGVALLAVAWQVATSAFIELNDHCGSDGQGYCNIAEGRRADAPYHRRILLSLVVRALTPHLGTVVQRFFVLNVLAALAVSALTALLVRRMARGIGRPWAALLAGALMALNPYTWHWVLSYPVITDVAATALLLGWVLLALRGSSLTVPLAAALVLTRDSYAVPLAFGAVALFAQHRPRHLIVANLVAVVVAAAFLLTLPSNPGTDVGLVDTVAKPLQENFGSPYRLATLGWYFLFGLGLLPIALLAVYVRDRRADRSARRGDAATETLLAAVAAGTIVAAVIGGWDVSRYLLATCALLVSVLCARLADGGLPYAVAVPLLVGTVLVWRPWQVVGASPTEFLEFWGAWLNHSSVNYPRWRVDALLILLPLLAAGWGFVRWPERGPSGR